MTEDEEDEGPECLICRCPREHATITECGHVYCWVTHTTPSPCSLSRSLYTLLVYNDSQPLVVPLTHSLSLSLTHTHTCTPAEDSCQRSSHRHGYHSSGIWIYVCVCMYVDVGMYHKVGEYEAGMSDVSSSV